MSLEDFGVRVGVRVFMVSEEKDQAGSVDYTFGVGKMPTKEEVDCAINECLVAFSKGIGASDVRITHLGDQGFARTPSVEWAFGDGGPDKEEG